MVGFLAQYQLQIAAGLAGASGFAALALAWDSWARRQRRGRRVDGLFRRPAAVVEDSQGESQERAERPNLRERLAQSGSLFAQVAEAFQLTSEDRVSGLRLKLMQAGWRRRDAAAIYLGAKAVAISLLGFLAFLVGPLLLPPNAGLVPQLLLSLIGGALGYLLAEIVVDRRRKMRQGEIAKALPDVLDLLLICTQAGMTFDAAVQRVAREAGRSNKHMADELTILEVELTYLPNRRTALENFARRTGVASVQSLVTILVQGERYGVPLSRSLKTLATEGRVQRTAAAEQRAARLPAIMTIPLVLFIMPALFLVVIGPAALSILDTFTGS